VVRPVDARSIADLASDVGGIRRSRPRHLADELQLVIAPLLVGQSDAVRMLGPAHYLGGPAARLQLLETRRIGDVVLLRYAPKDISTEPR
jgi:5-amino-6-(5-phosphoribosylamino)uracil reductase